MTDTESADPRAIALRCPHCASALAINMATEGRPYLTYEVAESIECDDYNCGATWEPNGTPRDLPSYLKYPDLYERPAR